MKKLFLLFSVIFLTGNLILGQNSNEFTVEVFQKNKKVEVNNHTVNIKSQKFDIVFSFSKPTSLLISATFDSTTYSQAINNKEITELKGFKQSGMAEGMKNSELNILLNHSAPSAWYYDDEEENRFNLTEKKNGRIKCTRTIKTLYDVNKKQKLKMANVKMPIFMVFISYRYDEQKGRVELYREILKINLR
ncbi:MAG: hypothetical protein CL840_21105 [Crocinitomicaceae bacterium]|nr:hypothetical protein [Crocinitomicaceae bacterium]|tara:strand:- start:15233 stop:15805 length:573 start_codon:yes stop_codon:yes gene_type:complete